MKKISIVTPTFNEEENISKLISPSAVHATNWNTYYRHVESGGRNLNNGNYQRQKQT